MADGGQPLISPAVAASAPGIGDLCFLSPEWVQAARTCLEAIVARRSEGLADAGRFTLCVVGHNPPWHSSPYGESYKTETKAYTSPANGPGRVLYGNRLACWLRFSGASFEAQEGELTAEECDWKVQGDHSVMSRLARVVRTGKCPKLVQAAFAQLQPQSKWAFEGKMPEHPVLRAAMTELWESMAARTIPRFVWMTTDWVNCAREIITARAANPKFASDARRKPLLRDFRYVFAEEFADPPRYASPDGVSGGFWVLADHGNVVVGSGPLPKELGEPDILTKGQYMPIIAGGRTVNAALTKEEMKMVGKHQMKLPKTYKGKPTMTAAQKVKEGSTPMPAALGLCMLPLHDELSLRCSGEVPSDFDPSIQDGGAPAFDRCPEYQGTWLRYDAVDVYGKPLARPKL